MRRSVWRDVPQADGSLASCTFHVRSLLATIQVRFIGDALNSIWQFTGASLFARPKRSTSTAAPISMPSSALGLGTHVRSRSGCDILELSKGGHDVSQLDPRGNIVHRLVLRGVHHQMDPFVLQCGIE